MKVLCKHYDKCEDNIGCYHSSPHDFTSGWSGLNSHYNCNESYWCPNCECNISSIRKIKINKIKKKYNDK